MNGRVLIVAGSDSGGGAGIQADIKAVTALKGYAATAITALTAQNTKGVFGVHPVPLDFLRQQMTLVLEDLGADAIKTGMLADAPLIDTVADVLEALPDDLPVVVDPVMVAKGGHRLLEENAVSALTARLLPRAHLLTPNLPEAEVLVGYPIKTVEEMAQAGRDLLSKGPQAVLMKGGHMDGSVLTDVLVTPEGLHPFQSERIETANTHGTGCTLASAIAAGLAQGRAVKDAVARARAYVRQAILTAPGYGGGHGPLNHAHTVMTFEARADRGAVNDLFPVAGGGSTGAD